MKKLGPLALRTQFLSKINAVDRYRSIFENALEGIFQTTPSGQYLNVNPALAKMYGYDSPEELVEHLTRIDHQLYVDPGRRQDFIDAMNSTGVVRGFESIIYRKDHSTIWISENARVVRDQNGEIDYYEGMVEDITERKRSENQIAEQAAFLDKARDAIVARDLEGKVLFWNEGAERIYGWKRDEILGKNIVAVLYVNPNKFTEINQLTLGRGEWSGELQHLTKKGDEIIVESRFTLIRDQHGLPKSILAIYTDITEKKLIEAQFLRAQRMESIGTLAGGIAHDLNNILTPIMLSIEALKLTSDNPRMAGMLDTIAVSAKRGADIVRQVLSFARGMEGERLAIQPQLLLKDLEHIIGDTFPKNIRLAFSLPGHAWTIIGDPTQIHQVLLNLSVNARDAMPAGGNLALQVENVVLDEHYASMHLEAKAGRYVKISVTDTGMGMPAELVEKIFEPFFTTKQVSKGTGLGLSTVVAIVKSHQGFINVYSEEGKGSTFTVYLPASEDSAELPLSQSGKVGLPRGNGETVLVIDDEASILTITSQTLQAFGYRVLTAMDGAQGVAVYLEHRQEIAVVLTDVMMPVLDGPATVHALKSLNPKIKIVMASGLNTNSNLVNASEDNNLLFLTKPYTAGAMLRTLRACLNNHK